MAETDKSGAERWTDGLKATGEKLRSAGERLGENTRAVNLRMLEQAEENAREAFRAMREAAQAGSLKDVAEIQARYLREQGKRRRRDCAAPVDAQARSLDRCRTGCSDSRAARAQIHRQSHAPFAR